jgi:xanthine dehydrogenase YagS FAD-binding subunit
VKPFDYERPADAESAVAAVVSLQNAAFLAGGTNLIDHLKRGLIEPDLLVDVSRLPMSAIEELDGGGIRIGATVRDADLASNRLIRERYPALAMALLAGAPGLLRNLATTGGNLLQRTRCPYFQDVSAPCNKRQAGSGCSAIDGFTRDQAILGASPQCIATHPSDMCVALAAFDADVIVIGARGERRIPLVELHRLPGDRPHQDTILEHGDLIIAVELPPLPIARRSSYRKVRDRSSQPFALVSVAAALEIFNGRIVDARIAFGGVAHKPWRARAAEATLLSRPPKEQAFRDAAAAELAKARLDAGNAFKVPLLMNLLTAVLREIAKRSS